MIVGYRDADESVFCTACWGELAQAGKHPTRILDTQNPDDPTDNFWIVDNCKLCGVEMKYLSVGVLD